MEKIEIVNKIINKISIGNKETGIIIFENEFRKLTYYISLKELWSTELHDIAKRIAQLEMIDNELVLLKSAPDIELKIILNELECKTIEDFKMVVE